MFSVIDFDYGLVPDDTGAVRAIIGMVTCSGATCAAMDANEANTCLRGSIMYRVRPLSLWVYANTVFQADGEPTMREMTDVHREKSTNNGLYEVIVRISPPNRYASNGEAEIALQRIRGEYRTLRLQHESRCGRHVSNEASLAT